MATLLDVALGALVLLQIIQGYRDGFIAMVATLLAMGVSLVAALRLYDDLAPPLAALTGLALPLAQPLSFLLLLVGGTLLLSQLLGALVRRLPRRLRDNGLNRVLGLLPGTLVGVGMAALLSALLLGVPFGGTLSAAAQESAFVRPLSELTRGLERQVRPIFDEALREAEARRTIHAGEDESITLGYQVTNAVPSPALEMEMFQLINSERTSRGLTALAYDEELALVAEAHSRDMFQRGYFSHYSPEGRSPFDRLQAANISYRLAGENLAHAATVAIAHQGLMASPGHRENILRPEFGRVGISILDGGTRGLMITQLFREPGP